MAPYGMVLKKIELQTIVSIRDTIALYGDQRPLQIELAIYLKDHKAKASGPSLTIYYDAEYRERDLDLETATPVTISPPSTQRVSVRELAGVEEMTCVIHHRPYETIGDAYAALMNWIETYGYRINGPDREVYLQCSDNDYEDSELIGYADYVTLDPNDYVTEIQIPVEKNRSNPS